jgi:hypothetical protein
MSCVCPWRGSYRYDEGLGSIVRERRELFVSMACLFAWVPLCFCRPLDLDFPQCFYPARQRELKARLAAIATMSPSALVADIGRVWRAHQGQACRGVSWTFPLQFLQLLAVRALHVRRIVCRVGYHRLTLAQAAVMNAFLPTAGSPRCCC